MDKPTPGAHEKFITIGFKDGSFVFGDEGEYPADATLAADLTAAPDGWQIATVYLGSLNDRRGPCHALSGPTAETAKRLLLDDDEFNIWANRYCRGLEESASVDARADREWAWSGYAA
jgi:hypothetical protein